MFDFVARWKEDFVSMLNSTFERLLMMEVFSRVCSGVLWGMRESVVSDSEEIVFFPDLGPVRRKGLERR